MGANLARVELEALFRHLLDRLEWFELTGPGRAPELGGQRRHQAPDPSLPPLLRVGRTVVTSTGPTHGRRHQGERSSVETMKFGIAFANIGPNIEPDRACELARSAEEAGFESLWTVGPRRGDRRVPVHVPLRPLGTAALRRGRALPGSLIWLAYVARATSTIRLATGILILPERNPVVLAKELAHSRLPVVGPGHPRAWASAG